MRAAVLGSPVAHSLSPALHKAAYRALGLTGWTYDAIECDEAGLPALLDGCGPEWAGLSLTMPLKRAVLPLLDAAEPLVTDVGGANTVIFAAGARQGHNTDVPGMITALTSAGIAGSGPVLILGGGATACSALAAAAGLGASEVTAAVRDPARASGLLAAAERLGVTVRLADFGRGEPGGSWHLLISTVPPKAADTYAERMLRGDLVPAAVLDVVYQPWPTALAAAAERTGAAVISGFELLLHQAARQVELMTARTAPTAAMRRGGQAELRRRAEGGAAAG
ncbi:MAG TPA: shikimate dehydrogenase [Streptosporangiaceae bacterium]|nr:shikimate dehydrogenase [Streptosporangiaceae bacterium]